MGKFSHYLKRTGIVIYLVGLHVLVAYLLIDKYIVRNLFLENWTPENISSSGIQASPLPTPEPETTPVPLPVAEPEASAPSGAINLIIPVQGVTRDKLFDTFSEARSEGRLHDAIDITAPLGTPVLAAADGEVAKFYDSQKGGVTIYQLSANRKYFFYYAHLERRDERIAEKQFVKAGTVIGYVGDSGNAGKGNYHLHFAITTATNPDRFWEGVSIDPYKILMGQAVLQ